MRCSISEIGKDFDLHYDICIVGAGAAGLAIANTFLGSKKTICLVESGGMKPGSKWQSLNRGDNVGLFYDLEESRSRAIGGTLHMWQGTISPLDPIDFEVRNWMDNSGWPMTFEDMRPWYQEAYQLLNVDAHANFFDGLGAGHLASISDFGIPSEAFQPKPFIMLKMQVDSLCRRLSKKVLSAKNIDSIIDATVTEIVEDPTGIASSVTVKNVDASVERKVKAQRFILCTGGLETPRLLLSSNTINAKGLGNASDNVGRYFMDHPRIRSSVVVNSRSKKSAILRHISLGKYGLKSGFVVEKKFQEKYGLANNNFFISPADVDIERIAIKCLDRLKPSRSAKKNQETKQNVNSASPGKTQKTSANSRNTIVKYLRRAWRSTPVAFRVAFEDVLSKQKFNKYSFVTKIEQVPNPNSRITLADNVDQLGVPKLRMNWQLSSFDESNIVAFHRLIKDRFFASGFDTRDLDFTGPDGKYFYQDSSHPIGTTRMSAMPEEGVVDVDLKVHGSKNVFICSSSVFPTGGNANATLTILALALRLAKKMGA